MLEENLEKHKRKEDGVKRLQEYPLSSLFCPTDGCSKFLCSVDMYDVCQPTQCHIPILTFTIICLVLNTLSLLERFIWNDEVLYKYCVHFPLSFKDQIQRDSLFNAAHFTTVIPRGDQYETGTAESERGPH